MCRGDVGDVVREGVTVPEDAGPGEEGLFLCWERDGLDQLAEHAPGSDAALKASPALKVLGEENTDCGFTLKEWPQVL